MNLTKNQLDTLCDIASSAGQVVMEVYARDFNTWHKTDASPLTEADLRADAIIRQRLQFAFPDVYILSEESKSTGDTTDRTSFFLVDPLDGTKEFLKRNDEFTVNIAWICDGQPIAGVVVAPALSETFYAAIGLGAWKRDANGTHALRTKRFDSDRNLCVIGSRSHGGEALEAWLDKLPLAHTFLAAGSSLKFCRIAEGQADIYPRFGPTSQWDTAAAHCVLLQAGGTVVDMTGQPLVYGLDLPILNPEFMAFGSANLPELVRPGLPL